ncbi:MAG: hypothetical protein O7G85_13625 [Planctomycetota bacterium]|nr:hypothetical protein [Planctomycetota bacterium]
MNTKFTKVIIAGAGLGFLETFSIWFVPEEPYPSFIVASGVLNGALLAILITSTLGRASSISKSLLVGGLFGLLLATVVYLAKGGWVSNDAPYVVPSGLVTGLLLGPIVRWLSRAGTTGESSS